MLDAERNRLLTEVGPGTPMGEVLRRHWHPVAAVDALQREPVQAVRLLGEDWVLFREHGGAYGLVERRCAHRGADLAFGYVENAGLRCHYHGWQFAADGRCVAQPYEDVVDPQCRLRDKARLRAGKVRALAGLLWAYVGPDPSPQLPDWEAFHWRNGFVQVVFADVPCNWLQAQENSIDPVHFEWMHANWGRRLAQRDGPYAPRHLQVAFEAFEHGLVYKRITEDTDASDPLWTIGRVCLWPNGFFLGDHFEWRVPVDDTHTRSVLWSFIRVPNESEPFEQASIPSWTAPTHDADGRWITSHVINQDIAGWVGQGAIADRTRECLGASDRGIAMMRRQFLNDIDAIAQGRDPMGVIRDADANRAIVLPSDHRDFFLNGLPRAAYERHPKWNKLLRQFIFHAGQPEAVRLATERATGVPQHGPAIVDL
ncbi:MAG: Rieske 2Fe-2S domain-containing protein [Lautropia sp.]